MCLNLIDLSIITSVIILYNTRDSAHACLDIYIYIYICVLSSFLFIYNKFTHAPAEQWFFSFLSRLHDKSIDIIIIIIIIMNDDDDEEI